MPFNLRIDGQEALKLNGQTFKRALTGEIAKAVAATCYDVQADAKRNVVELDPPAVNLGDLLNGIDVVLSMTGLSGRVVARARHSPYIEFGTRPHFPPISAIREWCADKGIDERAAYPIALKIAEHGTPERPFMRPAWQNNIGTLYGYCLKNYPRAVAAIPQSGGKR